MMPRSLPFLLLALSTVPSAPALSYDDGYSDITQQVKAPDKRAALVLDRLLVALQRALREGDGGGTRGSRAVVGPRATPLRVAMDSDLMPVIAAGDSAPALAREFREIEGPRAASLRQADDFDDLNTLQRRGPQPPRVRVIHCYFNAVTCF